MTSVNDITRFTTYNQLLGRDSFQEIEMREFLDELNKKHPNCIKNINTIRSFGDNGRLKTEEVLFMFETSLLHDYLDVMWEDWLADDRWEEFWGEDWICSLDPAEWFNDMKRC